MQKKYTLHARNRFRDGYDFQKLRAEFPELGPYFTVNHRGLETIDFTQPAAVETFNRVLLKQAYGIQEWSIPSGYLCPPVPGRLDYLYALSDLLDFDSTRLPIPLIKILDIGVGANCIFPILGVSEFGWNFVGAEIDSTAFQNAKRILSANPNLTEKVALRFQAHSKKILEGVIQTDDFFSAVMTNPPFHSSAAEVNAIEEKKWRHLGKAAVGSFGGQSNELWCEGGELEFISRLMKESEIYQSQVRWFTAFVSQEKTLVPLQKLLSALAITTSRVIEMGQGQKRSRLVAWTWQKDCTSFP